MLASRALAAEGKERAIFLMRVTTGEIGRVARVLLDNALRLGLRVDGIL
jgi:hypothetical protein